MPHKTIGNELINVDVFEKIGLAEGMQVGDLGTGNLGYFALPAAKIVGKKGRVYAVDILKSVLQSVAQLAKQAGLDNLKIVWSNLEIVGATKINDETLDAAFLHNVLFQANNDGQIIKEAYRLLKSGGKLMIIDWLKISAPFGPPVADRLDKKQAIAFAEQAGFRLAEDFAAGPYHYGLIFVK